MVDMVRSGKLAVLATLAFLAALPAVARSDGFFFKPGDRVVMLGDSITEQHLYSNYVEMWTVTRFPNLEADLPQHRHRRRHLAVAAIAASSATCAAYKPTALTVDFGMNDGGYGGFNKNRYQAYMNGLQGMADQAKAASIRVAWITPQPLDTGDQGTTALTGYNQTLEKFSDGVKDIADKNDGLLRRSVPPLPVPPWTRLGPPAPSTTASPAATPSTPDRPARL